MISKNQQAFLKERSILDYSMVASEVIHILSVRKERAMMLKLDFKKAFNSVSWHYLEFVMQSMVLDRSDSMDAGMFIHSEGVYSS